MKPYIKSKLLVLALASLARGGECGSFFGLCPKKTSAPPKAARFKALPQNLSYYEYVPKMP
ncbi:MAG: hypothetical protein U5L45_14465 [Saprospiraceae bacterium]|nr:hypothetical protein [Saprospiraceae bacterium]